MAKKTVLISIDTVLLNKLDRKIDEIGYGANRSAVIESAVKDFLKGGKQNEGIKTIC